MYFICTHDSKVATPRSITPTIKTICWKSERAKLKGRVKIFNIHGYGNKRYPESEIHYETRAAFEQSWKVIKDHSQDPAMLNGGNGA